MKKNWRKKTKRYKKNFNNINWNKSKNIKKNNLK